MGQHDKYGKEVFQSIVEDFIDAGNEVKVEYESNGIVARIDGFIKSLDCAIEIESRVNKQIRGAIVDLLSHKSKNKLLVLLPVHMKDIKKTKKHCKFILKELKGGDSVCKVVILKGSGNNKEIRKDKKIIKKVLKNFQ